MLLKLRSSVNWRLNAFACFCGASLFFLASTSSSAQETVPYYEVGASEGVWVESANAGSLPLESGTEAMPTYEVEASAMPTVDYTTASPYDSRAEVQSEVYETYGSAMVVPATPYKVVKNKNFFGVDKDSCCDEWSKSFKGKDLKFKCDCGGLKANKGHLGIPWLRTADAGEDCDYCNGGCCNKAEAGRQRRKTRRDLFSSATKKSRRNRCEACQETPCPEEKGCTSCR